MFKMGVERSKCLFNPFFKSKRHGLFPTKNLRNFLLFFWLFEFVFFPSKFLTFQAQKCSFIVKFLKLISKWQKSTLLFIFCLQWPFDVLDLRQMFYIQYGYIFRQKEIIIVNKHKRKHSAIFKAPVAPVPCANHVYF